MTPFYILLYIIYFEDSVPQRVYEIKLQQCVTRDPNYDINNILGNWFVVALIPGKGFPRMDEIGCYEMVITESNEAELRWLLSKQFESPSQEQIDKLKGTIIRQRYHSNKPFDIWSKAKPGAKGCYQQLFSLGTNKTRLAETDRLGATMQLHILDPNDGAGPYLVHILWGNYISAVIYRRTEGVTSEGLVPIVDFVTKMRGAQRQRLICRKPRRDVTAPPFERP